MANTNDTLSRAQSKPEKIAQWLFSTSANWRHFLGFILIVALTVISIRFNYELGKLSAVDETSKELLPAGYALLDLCCLFLSGFVGIKSRSMVRKFIAWGWFGFLLCLSLWAAASFTLSVDHRLANKDLEHAISQKSIEVESINTEVDIWRQNVAEAVNFKTKHQNTLKEVQARQSVASDELHALESKLIAPTMAIYHKAAPYTPLDADTLALLVRLLWAGAMTLSPLVIVLLVCAEFQPVKTNPDPTRATVPTASRTEGIWSRMSRKIKTAKDKRKLRRLLAGLEHHERAPTIPTTSGSPAIVPDPVESLQGNNQHTVTLDLRAFELASSWLMKQEKGRVNRAAIGKACGLYNRDGVSKVIAALIDNGLLKRLSNGQLSKPERVALRVV